MYTPEIIKIALLQNGIEPPETISDINSPIKLSDLVKQIKLNKTNNIQAFGVKIDFTKKIAEKHNKQISLTEKEVALLSFLDSSEQGQTKQQILEEVWGYSSSTNTKTVETHMHRLNSKFQDSFGVRIIINKASKYLIAN